MNKETCLICSKAQKSRGLCNTHHSEWLRKRSTLDESKQNDFDQACIAAGRLLPSRHTGRRKMGPFDDIFEAIEGGKTPEEIAKALADESEKLKPTKKKAKK